MFTAGQLIAHAVGDYVLQSDYMALEKTKKNTAALAHVLTYFLPFLFITRSPAALAIIVVTHFIIDRWRLARFVCWAKNFLQPKTLLGYVWRHGCANPADGITVREVFVKDGDAEPELSCYDCCAKRDSGKWIKTAYISRNHPWSECSGTGYHKDRPPWMSVWLMIICDNVMHVLCNGLAIHYFG